MTTRKKPPASARHDLAEPEHERAARESGAAAGRSEAKAEFSSAHGGGGREGHPLPRPVGRPRVLEGGGIVVYVRLSPEDVAALDQASVLNSMHPPRGVVIRICLEHCRRSGFLPALAATIE